MFWSRYVALCDKIGKAPNVVAAEVGVKSSGTVTGWKNGAKPRDGILQKLSAYFGVSVEYLTGEQKIPSPFLRTVKLKSCLFLSPYRLIGAPNCLNWLVSI